MTSSTDQEQTGTALKKDQLQPPPTRAEKRAAALDRWVKRDVAARREAEEAKKSRLRELRLARDAASRADLPVREQLRPMDETSPREANEVVPSAARADEPTEDERVIDENATLRRG